MAKQLFLFILLCLTSSNLIGQIVPFHPDQLKEKEPKTIYTNGVYVEFANLPIYSINYVRNVYNFEDYTTHVHLGISATNWLAESSKLRIPIRISLTKDHKKNAFYGALGILPYLGTEENFFSGWNKDDIAIFAELGYQINFGKNNFYLTPIFTPLLYDNIQFRFVPWGGVKLGKQF